MGDVVIFISFFALYYLAHISNEETHKLEKDLKKLKDEVENLKDEVDELKPPRKTIEEIMYEEGMPLP